MLCYWATVISEMIPWPKRRGRWTKYCFHWYEWSKTDWLSHWGESSQIIMQCLSVRCKENRCETADGMSALRSIHLKSRILFSGVFLEYKADKTEGVFFFFFAIPFVLSQIFIHRWLRVLASVFSAHASLMVGGGINIRMVVSSVYNLELVVKFIYLDIVRNIIGCTLYFWFFRNVRSLLYLRGR